MKAAILKRKLKGKPPGACSASWCRRPARAPGKTCRQCLERQRAYKAGRRASAGKGGAA